MAVVRIPCRSLPAPGLGHRDRGDELAGAVPGQPPLALLGGGQLGEVVPVDVVVHGEPGPGGAGHGQFLVEDQVVAVVGVAAAAVLLVDLDPEQPGPAGGEPDVPGHHPVPLPLLVMGRDLPGDEGARHVAERVVLGGEDVTLHRRAFLRWHGRWAYTVGIRGGAAGAARRVPSVGLIYRSVATVTSRAQDQEPHPRRPAQGCLESRIGNCRSTVIASLLHLLYSGANPS